MRVAALAAGTAPPRPARSLARSLAPSLLLSLPRLFFLSYPNPPSPAVPPARRDRPPQPALAEGARRAAHVCAAASESRSRRDEHALCRPRDATALPSRRWRRARDVRPMYAAGSASRSRQDEHALCHPHNVTAPSSRRLWRERAERPMRVPQAARRDRGGTSTRCAARAPARAVRLVCVPPAARRDRCGRSTRCAAFATRPPSPAGAGGGCSPCGSFVCLGRRRRVAIAAGRALAVTPARRDCPPQPSLAEGVRSACQCCLLLWTHCV